ncbi:MAG: sigma-E processing peptidase SpoIIGA, partial [Clostridia bacterium]
WMGCFLHIDPLSDILCTRLRQAMRYECPILGTWQTGEATRMIHAEAYLLCNAALCACALPLGGRLAGLHAPKPASLMIASLLGGTLCLGAALLPMLAPLAALWLPLAVWLCFRRQGRPACMRCLLTTLCATMLTGGAATALISLGLAAMPALLASAGISTALYLLAILLPTTLCEVRQVELRMENRSVLLPAMLDSGNLLHDPITSLPVLVVPYRALRPLFPEISDLCNLRTLPLGFRLLNVRTAAGSALLPLFRPDECRLYLNGSACEAELLVALAGREYSGVQALVPTAALPRQSMT